MVRTKEIVHTMSNEESRSLRRNYSPQLKLEVIGQCQQSGVSATRIALSHGINANIVHRWLREHSRVPTDGDGREGGEGRWLFPRAAGATCPWSSGQPDRAGHLSGDPPRCQRHDRALAAARGRCLRCLAARVPQVIRIDAGWLFCEPLNMRVGRDGPGARGTSLR